MSREATTGDTHPILSLAAGDRPEGIAVRQNGDILVGDRRLAGLVTFNEILRIAPGGTTSVFATLPASGPGAEGLLGLAVDSVGNVYAALVSFDGNHGVWRINRDGSGQELLPGSPNIGFPNGLAFDRRGNLYVTDSFGGVIWRSTLDGPFIKWAEDPLLLPLATNPFGVPLPGANGIAFSAPDTLYVANTEQGRIVRVRIGPHGDAGNVEPITVPFAVPTADGIAIDVHGDIYVVLPGFALVQASPVLKVNPTTGAVTALVTDPLDISRFDTPLSIAFDAARLGVETAVVTNGDLPVVPGGPGPGVVQTAVGVPGGAGR